MRVIDSGIRSFNDLQLVRHVSTDAQAATWNPYGDDLDAADSVGQPVFDCNSTGMSACEFCTARARQR